MSCCRRSRGPCRRRRRARRPARRGRAGGAGAPRLRRRAPAGARRRATPPRCRRTPRRPSPPARAATDWAAAAAGEAAFAGSAADLVRVAPVAEEFKALDRPIVRNSMRFRWREVRASCGDGSIRPRSAPTGAGRAADAGAFTPLFATVRSRLLSPARNVDIGPDRAGENKNDATGHPDVPCRDHHGRQRPLGRGARPQPRGRARARRAAGLGDRQGLPRPRRHPPDALRLLHRELAAAARRGRGADADLPPVHRRQGRGPARATTCGSASSACATACRRSCAS